MSENVFAEILKEASQNEAPWSYLCDLLENKGELAPKTKGIKSQMLYIKKIILN